MSYFLHKSIVAATQLRMSGNVVVPRHGNILCWYDINKKDSAFTDRGVQTSIEDSSYLNISDANSNQDLRAKPAWEMIAWCYPISTSLSETISKGSNNSNSFEFSLRYSSNSFSLASSISGSYSTAGSIASAPNNWWYLNFGRVEEDDEIFIRRNNVASSERRNGSVNFSTSSNPFRIGTWNDGGRFATMKFDGVGRWNRNLTESERAFLYNGGFGRAYREIGVPGTDGSNLKTDLVSWWEFDDPENLGLDSHGSNHLTSVNGPLPSSGFLPKPAEVGDPISFVRNQVGEFSHMRQLSSDARPLLVVNSKDKRVLDFDGVDDFIRATGMPAAQPKSVFAAMNILESGTQSLWDGTSIDTIRARAISGSSSVSSFRIQADGSLFLSTGGIPVGEECVVGAVYNTSDSAVIVDRGPWATGPISTRTNTGFTLGSQGNLMNFARMQVGELIIYGAAVGERGGREVLSYLRRNNKI